MQTTELLQTFYQLTPIFLFRRNKDNVQFPFSSTVCGGKHALQLRFPQNPILRLIKSFPFRTGSKHSRAFSGTNKFLQNNLNAQNLSNFTYNPTARVLNRTPEVQRAAALGVLFGYFFVQAKK